MELKEGMYVRTKDGKIKKLLKYTIDENADYINNHRLYFEGDDFGSLHKKEELPKGSYDITDLIEAGDYVNGYKLLYQDSHYSYFDTSTCDWIYIKENNQRVIKSIVTKEQFESISYKIDGE